MQIIIKFVLFSTLLIFVLLKATHCQVQEHPSWPSVGTTCSPCCTKPTSRTTPVCRSMTTVPPPSPTPSTTSSPMTAWSRPAPTGPTPGSGSSRWSCGMIWKVLITALSGIKTIWLPNSYTMQEGGVQWQMLAPTQTQHRQHLTRLYTVKPKADLSFDYCCISCCKQFVTYVKELLVTVSYIYWHSVTIIIRSYMNLIQCSDYFLESKLFPQEVYDMIMKNFQRHYLTNKAPFNLFYRPAW